MLRVKKTSSVITKKTLTKYKEANQGMLRFFDHVFNAFKVVIAVLVISCFIILPTTF